MLPPRIVLIDNKEPLVSAWGRACEEYEAVEAIHAAGPARIPSFDQIHAIHAALVRS